MIEFKRTWKYIWEYETIKKLILDQIKKWLWKDELKEIIKNIM